MRREPNQQERRASTGWRTVSGLAVLLAGVLPVQAQGGPDQRLQGAYEIGLRRSCVRNSAGFNPDLQPLVDSTTTTASIEGRIRYRGDGTGVYRGRVLQINHGFAMAGDNTVGEAEFQCTVAYSVDPSRRTFSQALTSCTSTIVSGPGTVLPPTTSTGIVYSGRIVGRTLLLSDTSPNVEMSHNPVQGDTYRICNRTGTALKN